ncbi:hypothetical protein ACMFMF_011148 [Clarireedia jacksonii]
MSILCSMQKVYTDHLQCANRHRDRRRSQYDSDPDRYRTSNSNGYSSDNSNGHADSNIDGYCNHDANHNYDGARTSLTLAAIQGGKQPASVSSQAAQPVATTLSSKESSIELTLGGGVAASTPPTAQAGTKSLSTSVLSSVTAAAMQLGAAAVAQPTPQAVDINSFSLRSSLMLGNLAVATSAIQ